MAETNPAITPEFARTALEGTFPGETGVVIESVTDEEVVGTLRVERRHLQPEDLVHAGVFITLADAVAAWGTYRHVPVGEQFSTVELKANVIASATAGDFLRAVGRPVHIGRRTQVWEVRVYRGERLAVTFSCTQMLLGSQR